MKDDSKRAAEVITRARTLLAGGWCQGHYAETANGYAVHYLGSLPVRFCLLGAFYRASCELTGSDDLDGRRLGADIIADVAEPLLPEDPIDWNDNPERTQADVVALCDRLLVEVGAKP